MRLLIVGDVHGRLSKLSKIADTDCDAVLQCGDIGVWSEKDFESWSYLLADKYRTHGLTPMTDISNGKLRFRKPVYFITGNHENFDLFDKMLADGDFDGRYGLNYVSYKEPTVIGDVSVSGLSGCFSHKVYVGGVQGSRALKFEPWTPDDVKKYVSMVLRRDPRGRFKKEQVEVLSEQRPDILLLHEIPMGMWLDDVLMDRTRFGCLVLNELIEKMQPKFVFAGHLHSRMRMKIGQTKVISLATIESGSIVLDTDRWEIEGGIW